MPSEWLSYDEQFQEVYKEKGLAAPAIAYCDFRRYMPNLGDDGGLEQWIERSAPKWIEMQERKAARWKKEREVSEMLAKLECKDDPEETRNMPERRNSPRTAGCLSFFFCCCAYRSPSVVCPDEHA